METARPMPTKSFLTTFALLWAVPLPAQEIVQALPGTTDADALAAEMRRLASNPRDVAALVDAAHLSLKLGDANAAAALLARAEAVDPRNAKVKAGQGAILVQSERPGQALRYFAQAESGGLDPRAFAADRGLAYDLTGEQERAQRDYRLALRDRPNDDEAIRRYALSLGISGQRQHALKLLDPLVRRSDRGAWRAQAFVLAMTGDVAGASRIATTMMPGGAAGLTAFFQRLPMLPATDRAFAVHFGQVRATPQRLADARLAPPLPALAREPGVVLASAQPVQPTLPARTGRRVGGERIQLAAARPLPTLPVTRSASAARSTLARQSPGPVVPAAATQSAPVQITSAAAPAPQSASQPKSTSFSNTAAVPVSRSSPVVATPTTTQSAPPRSEAQTVVLASSMQSGSTASTSQAPVSLAAAPPMASPIASDPPAAAVQAVQLAAVAPSSVVRARPPLPAPATRVSEDSILAKIVASLSIPAAELGVEGPERSAPGEAPAVAAVGSQFAAQAEIDRAAADKLVAARAAADKSAADKLVAKAAADKKAADRKALADKKALAEKKAAAAAKALADKEAAAKKKIERANPERIWVQVAGGAFEGDLPKAYAAVKAKAPGVFGSRGGWTTPLRATNRVLAGPFSTSAEARKFVNDLKKEGVSAFTFTSDAGQPVKRLGG